MHHEARGTKLVAVSGSARADVSAALRPTALRTQRDYSCRHERDTTQNLK